MPAKRKTRKTRKKPTTTLAQRKRAMTTMVKAKNAYLDAAIADNKAMGVRNYRNQYQMNIAAEGKGGKHIFDPKRPKSTAAMKKVRAKADKSWKAWQKADRANRKVGNPKIHQYWLKDGGVV